ncbi:hypothetical protein [Nostoc sp. UIC 10630]|uniref:hypothetical protein n=1 Tax=Nostoc sp. UIC 10630 TaxID=2100146 RepID=UPI0013D258B6|nr:hypothetical protein [Nostoc sp. UIC 10630]NEU79581.1 hypothetical protein [Nostoc sp. UIC 10630]
MSNKTYFLPTFLMLRFITFKFFPHIAKMPQLQTINIETSITATALNISLPKWISTSTATTLNVSQFQWILISDIEGNYY